MRFADALSPSFGVESRKPAAVGTTTSPGDVRRILIVSDAWHPQVNGVVNTLAHLSDELTRAGLTVGMLTPDLFRTMPMPTYPEIRLALAGPGSVARHIGAFAPDHVHIATEGPLGLLARRYCTSARMAFTTSYHTRFPEYLSARFPIPESWAYAALRRFHNAGAGTLVASPSLSAELAKRGFERLLPWTRGVDMARFAPGKAVPLDLPRPIFLYVGRVAVEKNLPAFLDLDLPGSKLVVGDGPALALLQARYPQASFIGVRTGDALAGIYAAADVFVFPSRTDTFGIVILEALASGLPVAAFNVTGPGDILADGRGGVVSEDLRGAALRALTIDRDEARAKAATYGWKACADTFRAHVVAIHQRARQPA